MKAENLGRLSLLVSVLPLTLFIIRHLKIGMDAPWVYIIFAVYALLIIAGFVFVIWLVKNKKTRTAISQHREEHFRLRQHGVSAAGNCPAPFCDFS